MKRVVVTGLGIVSSIGNNKEEVTASLREGRSGIEFCQEYADLGFRAHIHGGIKLDPTEIVDRKLMRFMGNAAAYNYIAMQEAIADSGLEESDISNPRTGIITGSGGASNENILLAIDTLRDRGARKVAPTLVPRTMGSTTSANLSTAFKIKGTSYSISSACSTSAHCIGNAAELIQMGKQDIMFAGGGEEIHWSLTILFDAMGALSSKYNDAPTTASRPYDATRDGFVISGGGGLLVLEELEHAQNRGAKIYAELVGYGAASDGEDMVKPSGVGAVNCMKLAMADFEGDVDYINAHGTATPAGDTVELEAVKKAFEGKTIPQISSTKSLTGHAQGAAGINEAVYSLLMLENDFLAASANITELDPGAAGMPIVREMVENAGLKTVMSNSFGFGGTNASLVFRKI